MANEVVNELSEQEIKQQKPYLEWGLTEREYDYISERLLGRLPNYTETGLFAVMWSEHCSYKKSKPVLKMFPNKNKYVLEGPGEGAGVVNIGDGQAVVFKAESHNHPSQIEPYEGAATGVGGILRDIFSMGARPVASLDSLHFGEIKDDQTRFLINEVVAGIGGYGNCMGIPTVAGEVTFDDAYQGNCLVNAMSVGIMDQKDLQQGQAMGVGNAVMYVGAKTGRDGIHGATFASTDFSAEKETQRSAVQVGDPFMEKLLLDACLELIQQHPDWLVGIQDMGAAGLVSSSCEMAEKGGSGMELWLDDVPQREANMSAYEIMLSESQERMLLCVARGHEADVENIFAKYELDAVVIGHVTTGHSYILHHGGRVVTDIPVTSLTSDVLQEKSAEKIPPRLFDKKFTREWLPHINDLKQTFMQILQQPTIATKKSLTRTYDSQVRTSTVVGPGEDSGVIRIRGTKKALAMTTDGNGRFVYLDPHTGGQMTVLEAYLNVMSSGAKPLAMTDCLNYGDPNDPEIFYELSHSVAGMAEACRTFDVPVISGNVSLYNESDGEAIYPTPMVGMVGLLPDVKQTVHSFIKNSGTKLYIIGKIGDDFAGSEIQKMQTGKIFGKLAQLDLGQIKKRLEKVQRAQQQGLVESCHDISEGGLAVTLAEMVFPSGSGLAVNFRGSSAELFAETAGRLVVGVKPEHEREFSELLGDAADYLGKVTETGNINIKTSDQTLSCGTKEAQKLWEDAIPCLMRSKD